MNTTILEPPPPPLAEGAILAITLYQPWASLFVVDARFPGAGKRDETRSFPIAHRGWLAIHAATGGLGKRALAAWCARPPFRAALARIGVTHADQLPHGAVVAVTRVRACTPTEGCYPDPAPDDPNMHFGDFSPGRFAWRCGSTLALPTPIPASGRQRLWQWQAPPTVWAMIHAEGGDV